MAVCGTVRAVFRAPTPALARGYEQKRHLPIVRTTPASDVCGSCWAHRTCVLLLLNRDSPKTCCVYAYFQANAQSTVEAMVAHTCEDACVKRLEWEHDDVPHDSHYCEHHCPVSRYLTDQGPSDYP